VNNAAGTGRKKVVTSVIKSHKRGTVHLKRAFDSAKWQEDKRKIIDSMNFHLTKHRPRVRMTSRQTQHRTELTSEKLHGQSLLQQRLGQKY